MLAFALSGCVTPPQGIEGVTYGVEQNDFFVPPRFEFVHGEQFEAAGPGPRSWTARYRGPGTPPELAPRYVRAMKDLGWEIQEIRRGQGEERILIFFREDEEVTVRVYRDYDRKLGGYAAMIEGTIRPRKLATYGDDRAAPARPATAELDPSPLPLPSDAPELFEVDSGARAAPPISGVDGAGELEGALTSGSPEEE